MKMRTGLLCCLWTAAWAQQGQVVAGGTVPDEASKAAILQRLGELYGPANVVDQIAVGKVVAPPNWRTNMQKLLGTQLLQVHQGALTVEGYRVAIRGDVANEATRQQVASDLATSLSASYTVRNALRVQVREQQILDAALGQRIIEFESGQAVIRATGMLILDEMAAALARIRGKRVEVIGHTDNIGARQANVALSQARAEAVRSYLVERGVAADAISVSGQGPDQPVADNATPEGRARNRRIAFRVLD